MVDESVIVASATTIGLALVAGCWRLAFLLGRIQTKVETELSHNGGGSLKDQVYAAKLAASEARDLIASTQDELRQHVTNSDMTHAGMWAAMMKENR